MENILKTAKHIHCIGINGTGLSALAGILREKGKYISGSDSSGPSHDIKNISPNLELIIYSAAVPEDNIERTEANKQGVPQISYPEAVGLLTHEYKTIAVCGTHGKTTVTGMIAATLKDAIDPTVIVGSNIPELNNKNYRVGEGSLLIIEACEYMRHFLNYEPDTIVITNIEIDHLDYFEDEKDYIDAFVSFLLKTNKNGKIIANYDDPNVINVCEEITKNRPDLTIIPYNKEQKNFNNFHLSIPGKHNKYNALAALTTALEFSDLSPEKIINILNDFKGAGRRFEEYKRADNTIIINDYAHHPTAIRAVLRAAREKYGPDKKILCIFQPHQYSRTIKLFKDFTQSFELADEVIIPNIFEVRDTKEDTENMSAQKLTEGIQKYHKKATYGEGLEETLAIIQARLSDLDIVIIMGAGNVNILADQLKD